MKIIGSGARHNIHDGGSAEADFRAEIRLLHFEFLHCVDRRRIERVHDGCVLLHSHRAHPVDQDVRLRIAAAVGDPVIGHSVGTERVPGRLVDPGAQ